LLHAFDERGAAERIGRLAVSIDVDGTWRVER